ncbi:MAG: hypothetical protein CME01_01900 [Geminicoccus sp.]|nr:hypothetical protein [Geminicoccus sp.]
MLRKMADSRFMTKEISAGLIKGKVVEQRAKLRRNIVSRLFRLGNAIQTQTQQLLALTSELSVVQFRILLRLRQAGTQNVQGISELLGANRSLVSRSLPDLRDKGWVTLVKSEEDKRQIFVRLTDAGHRVVDEHYSPLRARSEAMRTAFTDAEFEQLVDYLDRLDAVTTSPTGDFVLGDDFEDMEETYE